MTRWSLALAPLLAGVPSLAQAVTYLTIEQAQALMFPGQALKPAPVTLTPPQVAAIERASGTGVVDREVRAWRSGDGGWFLADRVIGKHEYITFAVALDPAGAVRDVEILDYRESYGDQVRGAAWRAQFVGKRWGAPLRLGADIRNISGATLSSKHVADGVRRLLATYELVLKTAS